jgi:hypothetical protein
LKASAWPSFAPPSELFGETNDISVTLLPYGTNCVLLAGDAQVK